jgi:hypothetical protein
MAYIEERLEPGETIVYKARVHRLSYIVAIVYFAIMMTPGKFSGLASTRLALTNKRIIGKTGMLMRSSIDIPYKDVYTVTTQQGILGKLFDYGTLIVSGKNGDKVKFKGISEPIDVKIQIDEAVEMAVLGRKLSQVVMDKW